MRRKFNYRYTLSVLRDNQPVINSVTRRPMTHVSDGNTPEEAIDRAKNDFVKGITFKVIDTKNLVL